MDDPIDRFIKQNRGDFEENHDLQKWDQIAKRLDKKQERKGYMWKAAAVIFFACTTVLLIQKMNYGTQLSDESAEIIEVEQYYTKLISQKVAEIEQYNDSALVAEFLSESVRLDEIYHELKTKFSEDIGNDKIAAALINNLQMQIRILNLQLEILQDLKQQKNENNIET